MNTYDDAQENVMRKGGERRKKRGGGVKLLGKTASRDWDLDITDISRAL